jgi:hypothetical protein
LFTFERKAQQKYNFVEDICKLAASQIVCNRKICTFEKRQSMRTQVASRKLHFIEELLKVENEEIIKKLESILQEERIKFLEQEFGSPMSLKTFNEMIDNSENDLSTGKITTSNELKRKIQKWK